MGRSAAAGTDMCIRHRSRIARREHNKLLITRQQNDKWLRETGRDSAGRLIRVGQARINARARRGIHQACRCGEEIRVVPVPDVVMCLGCEGIEHQLQPNAARAVPANNRLRSQDEDYPLRRRRTNDPRYIN